MKKVSIILLSFAFLCNIKPQSIAFDWVTSYGDNNYDYSTSITVDSLGKVYTAGSFNGTVDFFPGEGTYTLTSKGISNDIYIQKLDSLGGFSWAKRIGGSSSEQINSIKIDNESNIITTGFFSDTVDFDPSVNTNNLISSNGIEMFIQKMSVLGEFNWVKRIGNTTDKIFPTECRGEAIAVDADNNIYSIGEFIGTIDFDPGTDTFDLTFNHDIGGPYANDIFILKTDDSGNFIWAKQIGSKLSDYATSIDIDNSGNLYITGYFEGTVDFDPGVGTYNLTSSGTTDAFILKLSSGGDFIWAGQIGGTNYDYALDIIVDNDGNSFITGDFGGGLTMEGGSADFSPGEGIYELTSKGGSDIFVLKLDASGNFVWVKQMGGSSFDMGRSLLLDNQNNIYITGDFEDMVDFDPSSDTCIIASYGEKDIFVQKLDALGNFIWAKQIGGSSYDSEPYISGDKSGNIYITGSFNGIAEFDPGNNSFSLTSFGQSDIFVERLSPCTPTYAEIFDTTNTDYTLNGVIYSSKGVYTQTISNSAGCDSVITLHLTIEEENSIIALNDFGSSITYYPNPVENEINIEFNEVYENVNISILDYMGKVLYMDNYPTANTITLQIPYSIGLYFIKLESENKIAMIKILKN